MCAAQLSTRRLLSPETLSQGSRLHCIIAALIEQNDYGAIFISIVAAYFQLSCVNEAPIVSFFLLCSRLRRGQMKEASEMKYGDQVEGVCILDILIVY